MDHMDGRILTGRRGMEAIELVVVVRGNGQIEGWRSSSSRLVSCGSLLLAHVSESRSSTTMVQMQPHALHAGQHDEYPPALHNHVVAPHPINAQTAHHVSHRAKKGSYHT